MILANSRTFGGLKVEYRVVLPNGFDARRAYPTVLVFGGGPQNVRIVEGKLTRWKAEAERRGYILVSPAAPTDQLFFESFHCKRTHSGEVVVVEGFTGPSFGHRASRRR